MLNAAPVDTLPVGAVVRQIPAAGKSIRIGEDMDLWVIGYDEESQKVNYGTTSEELSN